MTKLFYVVNNQLPTLKAHGLQIMKMCEAFSVLGIDCELIFPDRRIYPSITEPDPLKYYSIKTPFKITKLPAADFITVTSYKPLAKLFFWLQQLAFGFAVKKYLSSKEGVIYSRDPFSLFVLRSLHSPLYWEMHTLPGNFSSLFYKKILSAVRGIITISRGLQTELVKKYSGRSLVAPDGVDLELFSNLPSRKDARIHLNFPLDRKIALYAGHLYKWKGIDTVLEAANELPEILFVFVGGTPEDIQQYQKQASGKENILFTGFVNHARVPEYLSAADVLLLPNSAKEPISHSYTSPLKLFEYMASGTPIVASDLPSLREILNEELAILVKPDNANALVDGIKEALESKSMRALHACEVVTKYSWRQRAAHIVEFMGRP